MDTQTNLSFSTRKLSRPPLPPRSSSKSSYRERAKALGVEMNGSVDEFWVENNSGPRASNRTHAPRKPPELQRTPESSLNPPTSTHSSSPRQCENPLKIISYPIHGATPSTTIELAMHDSDSRATTVVETGSSDVQAGCHIDWGDSPPRSTKPTSAIRSDLSNEAYGRKGESAMDILEERKTNGVHCPSQASLTTVGSTSRSPGSTIKSTPPSSFSTPSLTVPPGLDDQDQISSQATGMISIGYYLPTPPPPPKYHRKPKNYPKDAVVPLVLGNPLTKSCRDIDKAPTLPTTSLNSIRTTPPPPRQQLTPRSTDKVAVEIAPILGEVTKTLKAEYLKEITLTGFGQNYKRGIVLYDFPAEEDDEVSVVMGDDVIILDDRTSKEWWQVRRVKNGKEGAVASSYIKITGSYEIEEKAPQLPKPRPIMKMIESAVLQCDQLILNDMPVPRSVWQPEILSVISMYHLRYDISIDKGLQSEPWRRWVKSVQFLYYYSNLYNWRQYSGTAVRCQISKDYSEVWDQIFSSRDVNTSKLSQLALMRIENVLCHIGKGEPPPRRWPPEFRYGDKIPHKSTEQIRFAKNFAKGCYDSAAFPFYLEIWLDETQGRLEPLGEVFEAIRYISRSKALELMDDIEVGNLIATVIHNCRFNWETARHGLHILDVVFRLTLCRSRSIRKVFALTICRLEKEEMVLALFLFATTCLYEEHKVEQQAGPTTSNTDKVPPAHSQLFSRLFEELKSELWRLELGPEFSELRSKTCPGVEQRQFEAIPATIRACVLIVLYMVLRKEWLQADTCLYMVLNSILIQEVGRPATVSIWDSVKASYLLRKLERIPPQTKAEEPLAWYGDLHDFISNWYGKCTLYTGRMSIRMKTRMFRHKWQGSYFSLWGPLLLMHHARSKIIEIIDINNYSIDYPSSKDALGATLNERLDRRDKTAKKDAVFEFQLRPETAIPQPETLRFCVQTEEKRDQWVRMLRTAKAWEQRRYGFKVDVNGNATKDT